MKHSLTCSRRIEMGISSDLVAYSAHVSHLQTPMQNSSGYRKLLRHPGKRRNRAVLRGEAQIDQDSVYKMRALILQCPLAGWHCGYASVQVCASLSIYVLGARASLSNSLAVLPQLAFSQRGLVVRICSALGMKVLSVDSPDL